MLDATKVLSGSFGKLYENGEWLTNVNSAQAGGEISKNEIKISGSRVTGHKVTGVTFSGNFTGYKITTAFAKRLARIKDNNAASLVTELVMKLDDPDNPESKVWVRLKGVQFDTIPILNFEHGTEVTEETPFTFSDFEYLA